MRADRVEIEYCHNYDCRGHKAPDGSHCHFLFYQLEHERPCKSAAFGSKKAGAIVIFMYVPDEDAGPDSHHLDMLMIRALETAQVPPRWGKDREFVQYWVNRIVMARQLDQMDARMAA